MFEQNEAGPQDHSHNRNRQCEEAPFVTPRQFGTSPRKRLAGSGHEPNIGTAARASRPGRDPRQIRACKICPIVAAICLRKVGLPVDTPENAPARCLRSSRPGAYPTAQVDAAHREGEGLCGHGREDSPAGSGGNFRRLPVVPSRRSNEGSYLAPAMLEHDKLHTHQQYPAVLKHYIAQIVCGGPVVNVQCHVEALPAKDCFHKAQPAQTSCKNWVLRRPKNYKTDLGLNHTRVKGQIGPAPAEHSGSPPRVRPMPAMPACSALSQENGHPLRIRHVHVHPSRCSGLRPHRVTYHNVDEFVMLWMTEGPVNSSAKRLAGMPSAPLPRGREQRPYVRVSRGTPPSGGCD